MEVGLSYRVTGYFWLLDTLNEQGESVKPAVAAALGWAKRYAGARPSQG